MGGDTGLLSTLMGSSATLPARADAAKGITDKDASSPMIADVLDCPSPSNRGRAAGGINDERRHPRWPSFVSGGDTSGRVRSTRGAPAGGKRKRGAVSRYASRRAQGRALAGAHRLAAVRRARPGGAVGARARGDRDRCRPELVGELLEKPARRGIRRAARPRRRGRDGAGAAGGDRRPLHRLGARGVHALHRQGARQAPDARGRHPHAGLPRLQGERDQGARRGGGAADASGTSSGFRWWSSPPARAPRWA